MLRTLVSISLVLIFTSCKTIHNLASKDSSGAKPKPTAKAKGSGEVVFLDNITVTPGEKVTSRQTTSRQTTRKSAEKPGNAATTQQVSYTAPNTAILPSTIESVDALQLKYAIVFDATVEKMTNTQMLRSIEGWWGTRYCLGGSSRNCVDCSAFTQSVLKDVYNIDMPRTAQEQYDLTERIEIEDLKEGDLVFFYTSGRRISHVGIYIMNNKFVHAAVSQGVSVSDLNDPYWKDRYRGAGRFQRPQESAIGSK